MSQEQVRSSHRPKVLALFVAAFLAGGTAAVGVNRFVDVAREQAKPTVECEPIFVAIHPLPAGSPITVWDVALKDWPKATVPQSAVRPDESLDGRVVKVPLREGQPLLRSHLQATVAEATAARGVAGDLPEEVVAAIESAADTAASADSVEQVVAEATSAEVAVAPTEPTPVEPTGTAAPLSTFSSQVAANVEQPSPESPETKFAESQSSDGKSSESKEGWPTSSESTSGSMRFLVVPERIAILADQLVATPSPAVASRPEEATTAAKTEATPSSNIASRPKPASQRKASPRVGQSSAVPAVKVEPDPEAKVPMEIPAFKTVFPNMAAGIERIESEMTKLRKERLGFARPSATPAE